MRFTLTRGGVSTACLVLAVSTLSAAELSRYREFELGSSVATVTAVTQNADRDLKTVHSRPALLQELEWRPRYMRGAPVAGRESIDAMVFSFVDDRLFKMSVAYDRQRTTGLTNEDMIASITALYGAPSSPSAQPRKGSEAVDSVVVIAEWRQGDTWLALKHSDYTGAFTLVITALSLDATARNALATAIVLDAREAPARDAAIAQQRADDERRIEESARSTNKKVFRP